MARMLRIVVAGVALAPALSEQMSANPIRRVVQLLQQMQTKITEEGKTEQGLADKFFCECDKAVAGLKQSIVDGKEKLERDTKSLEEVGAGKVQLVEELEKHKLDREDAKKALAEATALRDKEAAAYAKDSSEHKTNVAALTKAIDVLEKGAAGSFLQTSSAARLRQLTIEMDLSSVDRDMLSAFLTTSSSDSEGYAPQSSQIIGILKQMLETMEKDLAQMTATEEQAIKDYEGLSAAKTKEIEAHGEAIETKTERLGKQGLEIVELQEDIDDTTKQLQEDEELFKGSNGYCDEKRKEWEERKKTRAEELVAIADTIKLLNDDDALELFKTTLPSPTDGQTNTPSFLQLGVSAKALRQRALATLRAGSGRAADSRLKLVMLALTGRSGADFDKVVNMIDGMVQLLGKEQADDDDKKAYCESSLDKAEDEEKVIDQRIKDYEADISNEKAQLAQLTEEIESLVAGIKAMDATVADVTNMRKKDHESYETMIRDNTAAKEIIAMAKNRLNKFYNPKLYKDAPKQELSAQDRIFVNNGGEVPTMSPPMFVQVSAHRMADEGIPTPPPEALGAYIKKGQESNGVLAMLDLLVADLDKEMQQGEVEERESQKMYEEVIEESKTKRAADAQAIAAKEGFKAETETELQKDGEELKATLKEGMEKGEQIRDMHLDCDWLLSNFEARKEARAGEADSLKNAKAVLSGADYALMQRSSMRRLRGGSP